MFEREIRDNTALDFDKETRFEEFALDLNNESAWLSEKLSQLEVVPVEAGETLLLSDFIYTESGIVSELEDNGGLYLNINASSGGFKVPILIDIASFTLDDRAGARCKLVSDYLNNGMIKEYAKALNAGFRMYSGNSVKILVRGGKVHAIHTNKYKILPLHLLFSTAKEYMRNNFPTSSFRAAGHSVERSFFDFSVCKSTDTFFAAYVDAWIKAGLPEGILKQSYPLLTFSTGDTGKETICITPKLKIQQGYFPLGTSFSIKHASSATEVRFKEQCEKAYSKMQEGLTSIEDMLKIELAHPYAVFVRAATQTGIVTKAKASISAVLNNFKDFYDADVDVITAFDVYYNICSIENFPEFEQLNPATKFQVLESLYRLLQIDWKKIDVSGKEEF